TVATRYPVGDCYAQVCSALGGRIGGKAAHGMCHCVDDEGRRGMFWLANGQADRRQMRRRFACGIEQGAKSGEWIRMQCAEMGIHVCRGAQAHTSPVRIKAV